MSDITEKISDVVTNISDIVREYGEIARLQALIKAEEAKKQFGVEIDKKKIVMEEPIKSFGAYELNVKLHPEVTAKLRVKVEENG